MGDKFVALVGSGRRTCHPSRDKKGLKDWAIEISEVLSCTLADGKVPKTKSGKTNIFVVPNFGNGELVEIKKVQDHGCQIFLGPNIPKWEKYTK
jgi:hypothetical protein